MIGLLGIIYILLGVFDEIAFKLFGTLVIIVLYSIIGLVCAKLYDTNVYKKLSLFEMAIVAVGVLFCALYIWEIFPTTKFFSKLFLTFSSIGGVIFWTGLLLSVVITNKIITRIKIGTSITVATYCFMGLLIIWFNEYNLPELYIRVTWIFLLLSILGTVLVPILIKIYGQKNNIT